MPDYPQQPYPPYDDEIDLIELVRTIWRGRWILIGFVVLGVILAGVYAFTAKQQWTSVARVSAPQIAQVSDYANQRRVLAQIEGAKAVDVDALRKTLLDTFIAQIATRKDQETYLAQSPYYEQLVKAKDIGADAVRKQLLLNQMAEKQLKIEKPSDKDVAQFYRIAFSAETPKDAQETLAGLMGYINKQAFALVDESFSDSVNAAINSRKQTLTTLEVNAKIARQQELDRYEAASMTAQAGGIKDYLGTRDSSDGRNNVAVNVKNGNDQLFMLGERFLNAQIATLKSAPLILPPAYYAAQYELTELEPLRDYKAKATSYFEQLPPTLPVKRDSPKRALILALGFVLGGLVGVLWIFGAKAVRREREKEQGAAATDVAAQK